MGSKVITAKKVTINDVVDILSRYCVVKNEEGFYQGRGKKGLYKRIIKYEIDGNGIQCIFISKDEESARAKTEISAGYGPGQEKIAIGNLDYIMDRLPQYKWKKKNR